MGIDVQLHECSIEEMDLGRTYRSIYLAGATFNLLPNDDVALEGLRRIHAHLDSGGTALIPLGIPSPVSDNELYSERETEAEDGAVLRFSTVGSRRDEEARTQTAILRYEKVGAETEELEREWLLHWHTQDGFRALATAAGLETLAVAGPDGSPAREDARAFAFVLTRS